MVREHHRHRSAGSARKSSFTTSLRRNSSGGFLSRVLGSFRHKHHEEKEKKTSAQDKGERQDWMANYKGTHHPDRPHVDKRTQEMVSDEEYAARLGWIRKMSDHGGPSQGPVPNFSYSSTSPRSHRMSSVSPTFNKTGQSFRDWAQSRETATTKPVLASPVLPGVGMIRIYNASALDRGPIIRYSEGSEKRGSPPPRKISTTSQPSKRRGSRGSMLGEKRTAADIEITKLLNREPKTPIYNGSSTSEHAPGLILNSSPDSPIAPQTCPWRGCHAVLSIAQEKEDNLCTRCREALFPRESAFFDPSPPVIQDTHLETLHALTGSPTTTNAGDIQTRTIRRRPAGLDKRSSTGSFKLLPAPRGKRRHIAEARRRAGDDDDGDDEGSDSGSGSEKESGNETDGSVWSPFSPDRKQQTSPGIQDAGPFSPLNEGIFGTSPRALGIRFDGGVEKDGSRHVDENSDKEEKEEEEAEPPSPHTKPPSDKSWTTEMYSTSSSSNGLMSPYSHPDMEITRDLYPPPLIARIQSGERGPQPRRPSRVFRSRDTLLYREIEDIIDCYAYPEETETKTGTGTGTDIAEQERHKADAVASYFPDEAEAEAEDMRRRGFI
ncbi:uncharacterized protein F4817DRAFT_73478 [Daldinia loculata]|uniref:uncharacterized protein n=1 Tax=Daldinia loculata TaxID=103429 RepID=UPI0020C47A5A|nr:uncharacterized protein F4817DRAFT_73478 [Daldinia loculata]KAI1648118.1 hypothetical protein F4817DRAFT_73478 [Daldinia loculata]